MSKGKRMPPRLRQSNVRHELVSQEILEKAAALFAQRGFSDTSLQDVAKALGISRTALYHYIGGKDELLATLVRGLTGETAESLERIASDDTRDPVDKLRAAVRGMATRIAQNPARFRLLLMSEGSLPEPLATEHNRARRRALRAITAILRAGIQTGQLRPTDERIAAFGILGMCNWVAWWYQPGREKGADPEQIADQLATIAVAGLLTSAERSPKGSAGVEHAMDLLRKDLDYLQRALQNTPFSDDC
jgi:AcrR family transcriptional regulator